MDRARHRNESEPLPAAIVLSDPFARVVSLGPRVPAVVAAVACVFAVSVHGFAAVFAVQAAVLHAFASWVHEVHAGVASRLAQTYDIVEDVKPPEPVKPEEPPPVEPPPAPKAEPKAKEPAPPPPAAADAARVLMQEPAKDEPVDLTGNTFLAGNADTAVGGTTQIGGTAKTPTTSAAAVATGVPGGNGNAAKPPGGVDRSRSARIANLANLERCPFPAEADAEQIDEAVVGIDVRVSAEGRPESVAITSDPGHGFAREARKCALREKYEPALDTEGAKILGTYRVRFKFSR
jgi:protein TonB